MGKYFCLQGKRLSRILPGALLAALVLLGGLLLVFRLTVEKDAAAAENQKFRVAMVGCTDDPFLQAGMTAISGFDSARFSLDIRQMDREQAERALSKGQIAAYVEIPQGFIDEAMMGNILPLKFVSTTGAAGLTSIVKDEITDVIASVLRESQKGVYGMEHAVRDNGLRLGDNMNVMALRYTEYILARDKLYSLVELGIGDALGLEAYLLCGLSVLFLCLCCLPFASGLIRRDVSLQQMLSAKGQSAWMQTLAEFTAYLGCLLAMVLVLLLGVELAASGAFPFWGALIRVLPVVLMVAAMSYMLCCLSTDLTGGVLLQFFTVLAMCFVSGCLYPVYMFPTGIQKAAEWLPTGIARSLLSGCVTGQGMGLMPVWLVLYAGVFLLVGGFVTRYRIKGAGR